MVTLGGDSHKRTHTLVAVDDNGRQLAQRTLLATRAGHLEALQWAGRWPERRWALEDCRHVSRRFEADLLVAGEVVVRVPSKLTGAARKVARTTGKSDPIDALAVARAALREPDLPVAKLDGPGREVRLLLDHREDLVGERTRTQNRLRWHLHELEPEIEIPARTLTRYHTLAEVEQRLNSHHGVVAAIGHELVIRVRELTRRINELEGEIERRVSGLVPTLLQLNGCGALCAAKVVGEAAGVSRFRSRAAFAMHNGTAPVPVSSGNQQRHRLNRGGNRQLNVAMHRIAVTQLKRPGPAQDYMAKRMAAGNTKTEALRALKRRISDEVYRRMLQDERASLGSKVGACEAAA
ncbi:MAG TPA: IS110 family transposase [Chloroflexi bacterium]|nr:IS110 family transposase [Chloroflexota bacterium]